MRSSILYSIKDMLLLDAEQTLDNIIVCRVFTHEEQMGKVAETEDVYVHQ